MSSKRIAIVLALFIVLGTSSLFLWPREKRLTHNAPITPPTTTTETVKTERSEPVPPLAITSAPTPPITSATAPRKRASKATRRAAPSASVAPHGPMVDVR
jgi:hypothetical protein